MQQLLTATSVPAAPCSQRHSSERSICAFGGRRMAAAKTGHIDVWSSPAGFGAIFSSCHHGVPRQLAPQLRHRCFLGPADLSYQLKHFIIWRQTPGWISSWRAAAASAAEHEADGSLTRSMILAWDPLSNRHGVQRQSVAQQPACNADSLYGRAVVLYVHRHGYVNYTCLERRRVWAAAESDVA